VTKIVTRASWIAAALTASTALTPAFAQSPLDEVIVTAQKREQNLQDVAQSVDIVRGDELDALRGSAEDILFLSARVPSVYAEGSFGRTFPRFYIRGLGNTDFDLNANQPVSLVYDDVVLENPILKGFPVFDTARVEVLRGPQGTLFGRNTPAGVIKFESARPTQEFEGYAKASYGRFQTGTLEAAVSGGLSDTVSARASGLYQTRDAYVENVAPAGPEEDFEGFDELAGRFQLLIEPKDANVDILVNVHGRKLNGGSRTFRANAIQQGTGGLVDGFDRFTAQADAPQLLDVANFGANLKVNLGWGEGTLTSVTALETVSIDARGDVDGGFGAGFLGLSSPGFIPFPAESQDNITDHRQITQELRYNVQATDALNLTAGVFVFLEDLEIESLSFDTLFTGGVNGRAVQEQDTSAYAAFTSLEYALNDRLTATGGLRLTVENKDFIARRTEGPFGSGTLGPVTRDLSATVLSGDFTLDYALNDAVNLYGRYSRGFRSPNVQGRIVFGDAVTVADTEFIDSFEAGFKSTFMGGRGVLNGAAYYYETKDQQVTAVGGAGNFNQLFNADSVQGMGIELDAFLNPTDNIELTAGFSINDTEIDDPDLEVGICGSPCTVLDPISATTGNALIDGNPLPQAPKYIANATARYGFPLANGGELFAFGDIAYRSEVNFFLYESEEFRSEALTEIGLRGGYVHNDGQWEVAGYVRNLTGQVALEGGVDFNNLTGFLNEPSTYGVEILTRF
jgi:iron complex outermembrane receptor protein